MAEVYGDFGDFKRFWAAKNKPKQSQLSRIAYCVLRIALKEFEKTKPIYRRYKMA